MKTILQQKEFLDSIKPLISSSMGTEEMAPLLYSIIKFTRPHRVLEIGAGLTSIYILAALSELSSVEKNEFDGNSVGYDPSLKNEEYYKMNHSNFILHSFDNLGHPETSANKVLEVSKKLNLDKYLKFWNNDYLEINKLIPEKERSFDLIWCDLGGLNNYLNQREILFPLLSDKVGSYIIFHSTLSNVHGLAFLNHLKLSIYQGQLPGFELVSLFEPQKKRQNSCTIIRKARGISNRIYSERP